MRVAAADHHSIGLARSIEIIGVAAFAPYQFGVFAATYWLTNAKFGQRKCGFGGSIIHFDGQLSLVLAQLVDTIGFDKNSLRD